MEQTDSVEAQPEQTTRRRLNRRGWRRLLWWTGLAILTGVWGIAETVSGFGSPFWMIGPFITSAARLIGAGTLVGVGAWIACLWLWAFGPHSRPLGLVRRIWRVVCIVTIIVTAGVFLILDGAMALLEVDNARQTFHVLPTASPGGCRVVLWRTPDSGYGQSTWVYLKTPGSATLQSLQGVADVNLDAPEQNLGLTLTWSGEQGHLLAQELTSPGSAWNPYPSPITCPAR
ncbi:hypothetical protein [Acidipropionibacterium jensenii]|uniref:Uncharacterized protein n=1 Tax=Acidipropionibacterium jensenii TaxID=1749 RepID=A0A3S4V4C0_9ACTN|nr:hypothetical protein [Acidipropionibacterium jensenii]MDN5997416.1 hypothetical protein [Acidipropionibacterium jensenii]MDN6659114.1 hypothetical protein [Acidipropionibacterium jensenii]VEI04490.1 Uncharacterised protein [Acidipropionibacterium jensenii]